MGIVVDILIILIFITCIYGGYRKGLAKCLLKIATSILAIIVALISYGPFVNFIVNNTTIDDNIAYSFEKVIDQNEQEHNSNIISDDSGLPKPIIKYINENISKSVNEQKDKAISDVSKDAARLIINIFGAILIFIITKILLQLLEILTDIVAKLPIIKQCNKLGGIIYGILEAIIIIFIIFALISFITPLIGDYTISNIILESTFGKILYNNNIFLNIIF